MKRSRFCPSCGDTIETDSEFCVECKPPEDLEFKELKFDICERCDRYNFRNKWVISKGAKDAIVEIITHNTKVKLKKVTPHLPNVTMKAGVNVDFKLNVLTEEQEYELPGRFLITICPRCSKEKTTYFEGILQLRNPKPEVKAYIQKLLDESAKRGIYANSIKEVTNGLDYYITSKAYLRKMGKELKKRFDGDFNESAQLFSRNHQTSKDIYRLNVLFRCK